MGSPRVSRRNVLRVIPVIAVSPSVVSAAADEIPLAIKGYDPVAYFSVGAPAQGRPEMEHEWDGLRYRFSRPEHRELFKADPARYAPQFGNFCAMALSKGEIVEADPQHWLISEGKLYLFGKSAGPGLFQNDLVGNIAKAKDNEWMIQKR
jgi:hypothetical protein